MLLSMTGQGQATIEKDGVVVHVELRSVNNRFLKISSRLSDIVARLESELESILRQHLRRGTIQVSVRVELPPRAEDYRLNQIALESYVLQASQVANRIGAKTPLNVGDFVGLPGVIESQQPIVEDDDPLMEQTRRTILQAAEDLNRMRKAEGESMAKQLASSLVCIETEAALVETRAPGVIDDYRNRLENKIKKILQELSQEFQPIDILREVQIFADRADIREELVRLASHIKQFREAMQQSESQGRKLDFLIQEFFREINTIGSKGSDAIISKSVVEMKTIVEQMRELVQNVE